MNKLSQREKAERFRKLHHSGEILVLPNAWDVSSARVFEEAGFPAIATSSGGIAAVLGYPDGQRIPRDEMIDMVARIARAVNVPVSADMEEGYGDSAQDVAETARMTLAAGAIGMNLEDGTHDSVARLRELDQQITRLRAARETRASVGVPLVINARTDVFLYGIGPEAGRLDEAVRRAQAYLDAGADCAFVPGVRDPETIAALTHRIRGPINLLAGPGTPPASELRRLGVARVSVGSGPMRAALTTARRIAEELRESGSFDGFTRDVITHAEVNRLMSS